MEKSKKNSIVAVGVCLLAVVLIVFAVGKSGALKNLRLVGGTTASASVFSAFVEANNFAILGGSTITNTGNSVISGDLGLSPGTAITGFFGTVENDGPGTVSGSIHQTDQVAADAQTDLTGAYVATANETCGTDLTGQDLGGLTLTPGVYCFSSSAQLTGTLTLNAEGNSNAVFVFQIGSTLTTASGSSVVFTGGIGSSCNVFWQVGTSATLGATTSFKGNIFALTAISTADATTVDGRLLARSGAVTLINTAVTAPVCVAPVTTETITVVKVVVGGAKTISDFPLFVDGTLVTSGDTNSFSAPATYTITETKNSGYLATYSGDCPGGVVNLTLGTAKVCTITNTYNSRFRGDINSTPDVVALVAPLIDVVKVPSPLALPNGPGLVAYTYTVRNIGTVPMLDVTMVGDSCSPIILGSGDTNGDSRLDVTETWVYNCSTTLTQTHTNTVVATGWANGVSAVDIASATVVVGVPLVPPLIHVTKIPSVLTLFSVGGLVTYTETVTNPGTVPLSNISVIDDKCSPVVYGSGDTNNDSKLDVTESWVYTCRSNLVQTTTNTVTVTGEANGLTARDFAIATVVVSFPSLPSLPSSPSFPSTGFSPL